MQTYISAMQSYISDMQKYIDNMSMTTRVLSIIICVFIFVFLYNLVIGNNKVVSYNTYENFSNPKTCTYYYMNNCGYCDKFNPEWDKFVAGYSGPVVLQKKERQEAGDELNNYNIEGFPTVILTDENGEHKEFNGDRTSDGLNTFVGN
jgi:hypothetical protein